MKKRTFGVATAAIVLSLSASAIVPTIGASAHQAMLHSARPGIQGSQGPKGEMRPQGIQGSGKYGGDEENEAQQKNDVDVSVGNVRAEHGSAEAGDGDIEVWVQAHQRNHSDQDN